MAETSAPMTPVALSPTAHKGIKVKQSGPADHIRNSHFAKIYTQEFIKAGTDYPIIFIQDPQTQEFFAAVMWGLEAGENLFVEGDKWEGGYYPASVRCFPFAMSPDPQNPDHLFIGLFETSPFISREEGELIFNDDGSETKWMSGIKEFLVTVYRQEQLTSEFVKKLDSMELLVPQSITVNDAASEQERQVSGFSVVDREKLAQLPDETFLEMRKSGALELIYYHLMSLESLDNLMRKKNAKAGSAPGVPPSGDVPAEAAPTE